MEAENLARFQKNFESLHSTVIFPKLIPDLVSIYTDTYDSTNVTV